MSKNLLAGLAVVVALLCGVLVWSIWAQGGVTATDLPVQETVQEAEMPANTTTETMESSTSVEIGSGPGTTTSVQVIVE